MSYHEFKNTEVNKTRKDHQCAWCGETIAQGSKARYRAYTFDGFTSDYMHPECYQAMVDAPKGYIGEDGFMPGEFKRGRTEAV